MRAVDSLNKIFHADELWVQLGGHCSIAVWPVLDVEMVPVPFAHLAQKQQSELQRHLGVLPIYSLQVSFCGIGNMNM